jgi:uncharacterized protein YciI
MTEIKEFIYLLNLQGTDFFKSLNKYQDDILLHLQYLHDLKKRNLLIFAGTSLDEFYEIVVIKSEDRKHAEKISKNDPYVKNSILTFELYDFRASLVTDEELEEIENPENIDFSSFFKLPSNYYLGTITGRHTFISDITEEEREIMGIHYQYLKQRFDEKKLVLAGPILAHGAFGVNILEAECFDEADQYMKQDPSVLSGIMKPGIHPFRIFFKGSK